jgi:hypothetical protein
MRKRSTTKLLPGLEALEEKRLMSVGASTAPLGTLRPGSKASAGARGGLVAVGELRGDRAVLSGPLGRDRKGNGLLLPGSRDSVAPRATKPDHGYLVYRITNPNIFNNKLIPPFSHVLVQSQQPEPGQVYNVLYVAVRNGTARTFDAGSGFRVRFPGSQASFPILEGSERWEPGEWFVFYVLTKEYYPVPNVVSSGFEFDLGDAYSVAIPGPSGIFLRVQYRPDTFDRTLDWIVAFGPGNQGGKGVKFGLPDTAIYEFLSARTRRMDFGGYF